ncbi:MAG: nitrile hydratase accessory protein [Proteobacteria bacterium]|nr:nitrile hydratase accessory protein [Pseudomonadota bacterium]MDA0982386.1 nitrile hydratase accessory protein [Pseudomonadota bacterium]
MNPPAEAPVFNAPWEASAFAMALQLHQKGLFTWNEWAETLAQVIRDAQAEGDPDLGDTYYLHWVRALERLMIGRGLADEQGLAELAAAIADDARNHRELQLGAARPQQS